MDPWATQSVDPTPPPPPLIAANSASMIPRPLDSGPQEQSFKHVQSKQEAKVSPVDMAGLASGSGPTSNGANKLSVADLSLEKPAITLPSQISAMSVANVGESTIGESVKQTASSQNDSSAPEASALEAKPELQGKIGFTIKSNQKCKIHLPQPLLLDLNTPIIPCFIEFLHPVLMRWKHWFVIILVIVRF